MIEATIAKLASGEVSEARFEMSRLAVMDDLRADADDIEALVRLAARDETRGASRRLSEQLRELERMRLDDVVALARELEPALTYVLSAQRGGEQMTTEENV